MNTEKYNDFINEQKEYFVKYIQPYFQGKWDDCIWYGGTSGSGWLLSRSGKTHFNFELISKIKGIDKNNISKDFQFFMKAMIVLSYRKANSNTSAQKLFSEFVILKRWYSAMQLTNPRKKHPCYLSTLILDKSYEILIKNTDKKILSNYTATYLRLQEMINHFGFTDKPLNFYRNVLNINRYNRTKKALETKGLLDQLELDENALDDDKLISIKTFINVVSLTSLCKTNGEKIAINLLLLLIITGLRSTEVFLLKTDALIRQPILDPVSKKHLTLEGVEQFTLGIQYYGAKGSGLRIHWLEPLAARLVEKIFHSVNELTKDYREHLSYIRLKKYSDYLPKLIDDIPENYVEVDDLIGTVFGVKDKSRGRAGQRDVVVKSLKKIPIHKEYEDGKGLKRYYLKKDINDFIKSLTYDNDQLPLHIIFNYEGNQVKIPYDELLFIHEYRSMNLKRLFVNKSNIIPFNTIAFNNFLGNGLNISVFEKYSLFDDEGKYSKLTTHIPRHNINTFLALSGISEHLQAMLMGRIDIKQNQHYQHLALKQRRIASDIIGKYELNVTGEDYGNKSICPIEAIQDDGLAYFSENLDLESNLKMNFQTFDSKAEVAEYIKNSFFDDYFGDISKSFNEQVKNNVTKANLLIERHAYLYPLPFGACMRNVGAHGCPKSLGCQSGEKCGNFVLTGRKGELNALENFRNKISSELNILKPLIVHDATYGEMLEMLNHKILYIDDLISKALTRQHNLIPISIFPYSNELDRVPKTLSELFAIEQQIIEIKEI